MQGSRSIPESLVRDLNLVKQKNYTRRVLTYSSSFQPYHCLSGQNDEIVVDFLRLDACSDGAAGLGTGFTSGSEDSARAELGLEKDRNSDRKTGVLWHDEAWARYKNYSVERSTYYDTPTRRYRS